MAEFEDGGSTPGGPPAPQAPREGRYRSEPWPLDADDPPVREGLPADYRMRHDAHYVEQLAGDPGTVPMRLVPIADIEPAGQVDARRLAPLVESIRRVGVLQPLLVRPHQRRFRLIAGARRLAAAAAAGLTVVPCLVHEVAEGQARDLAVAANLSTPDDVPAAADRLSGQVMGELASAFETLASCLALLSDRGRPLRERTSTQLMRVEVQQALRMTRGLRVLAGVPPVQRREVHLRPAVERAMALLEPERRVLDVRLLFEVDEPVLPVAGDPGLIETAIVGIVGAVFALLECDEDGTVRIRLSSSSVPRSVRLVVSQDSVLVPPSVLARVFELTPAERTGGDGAAIALAAARRIAELHGGRLEAVSGHPGCQLRLDLPAWTPAASTPSAP